MTEPRPSNTEDWRSLPIASSANSIIKSGNYLVKGVFTVGEKEKPPAHANLVRIPLHVLFPDATSKNYALTLRSSPDGFLESRVGDDILQYKETQLQGMVGFNRRLIGGVPHTVVNYLSLGGLEVVVNQTLVVFYSKEGQPVHLSKRKR